MCVGDKVRIIDGWEYAPASVHLRVVLIDFGDKQKDRDQEEGECKRSYERVC